MRSPKVLSRSEVWKGSNLTWSRTHHRSFKYTPTGKGKRKRTGKRKRMLKRAWKRKRAREKKRTGERKRT